MDIDDVLVRTGEFGKFQKKAFFGVCITTVFCGTQMVQNMFAGAIPVNKICLSNASLDACDVKCTQIGFPDDPYVSYATEWNMTCGAEAAKMDSTQSLYMLGVMTGSFFMGGLGDKFGRLPVLFWSELLCSIFAFCSSFAPFWKLYAALRFITGFFLSGIIIVGFVLTSELVGPSKRGIVGTIPALTFALGICLLSMVAWIFQNWRTVSIIFGVFGVISAPPLYWLYEESPRWHLGKGNVEKCKQILKKIATVNGHDLGQFNLKLPNDGTEHTNSGKTSILDLFKNRILLKITVVQMYSWFTVSCVYYGLTLAAGDMGDNRYISVILSAFVEIPSNLVILYFMNVPRLGRVKCCVGGLIVSALCCGCIKFINNDYKTTIVALACGGKFFIVMSFAIVYVQAAELYPTPVRNLGLGVVSIFNRIGGVLAPLVISLDHYSHNLQFLVFSILGLICAGVCLVLPETLGRPLPDTPEDIYTNVKKLDKNVVKIQDVDSSHSRLLSNMEDEDEEEEL